MYDVYWKISPMSLRSGRCNTTSASTSPSGPELSSPPQPAATASSAAPNEKWLSFFTGSSYGPWALYKSRTNPSPFDLDGLAGVPIGWQPPIDRGLGVATHNA